MQNKLQITREKPYPLGCYIDYDNSLVVRAVFDSDKACGVTLYPGDDDNRHKELSIVIPRESKRGTIYSARIKGIADIDSYVSYNYFQGDEYFCDPYAKHVLGLENFGKYVPEVNIRAKLDNRATMHSNDCFDWGNDASPQIPYEESFVYLIHVRGYTKSPGSNVSSSKRGTFSGVLEKISYLKELGVTTLELMPAYEMNEVSASFRKDQSHGKQKDETLLFSKDGSLSDKNTIRTRINYWGYQKGYYFAPRTSFCQNPDDAENEFKNFVKTLHENGIEVVMQFYFEEDESESLILDALRYWRCSYHVDGFHLKGARIPKRLISMDPLFTDVKLWYEWFEYGDIAGSHNPDKRYLAEYNNGFLYSSRRFLKSDDNTVNDFLRAMTANSPDHGIINYISDYEGFRLYDLVSYEHKHNEENGENNKDGSDNNLSWNCGIEGRTRRQSILSLRKKQIKNILTMLFLSQGTPMIFGGDEFGNSQGGNNNPYCQDNETGWVDWKALEKNKDILDHVKFMIALRNSNKILHGNKAFKLMDYISCGYPDLSCHGKEAWRPDLTGYSHILGMLYCGLYDPDRKNAPFIYVCYNMYWNKSEIALPSLPEGLKWRVYYDTSGMLTEAVHNADNDAKGHLQERSVRIYLSEPDPNYKKKKEVKKKKK